MPLCNINVDRVLTTEEVAIVLNEDAKKEDAEFKVLLRRWKKLINMKLWSNKLPTDRAFVKAWAEGRCYKLKSQITKKELVYFAYQPPYFFDFWFEKKPSIKGLSMYELESLVEKMEDSDVSIIQILLDAGFVLDLLIPCEVMK
jgi:hypothetical protein